MGDTRAFAELEKREWSEPDVAGAYASGFSKASDMVVPHLVAAVDAGPDTDVLDLCCGHGNVSAGLVGVGARVTGLDFSAAMLELARAAVPGARFVSGDAMQLSFPDASFDAVTIGFGMPHVPEPPRVVAEVRRVLKPGGRIAFSTWCGPEVDGAFGYVFGAIGSHGSPEIVLPPGPGANDYADPDIAYPVLEAAGFGKFRCEVVASCWHVNDPGLAFDFFRDGTARGGALLRPQPDVHASAIRAAVVERVLENHGDGPEWIIPMPAVVISAQAI
ncbi:Methyltransferase domain-containing protein [Roseovarius tolerans]|uniref:Methyltransferase domain-containing protein n=1 Tax=Roseovarius tolerans TaxID=74031 RepID=A0A1H8F7I9_9RHOB|nr:Methyltransferase domain-containing protein [Roseovarius tolerans]